MQVGTVTTFGQITRKPPILAAPKVADSLVGRADARLPRLGIAPFVKNAQHDDPVANDPVELGYPLDWREHYPLCRKVYGGNLPLPCILYIVVTPAKGIPHYCEFTARVS